jgi:hypothetical protein
LHDIDNASSNSAATSLEANFSTQGISKWTPLSSADKFSGECCVSWYNKRLVPWSTGDGGLSWNSGGGSIVTKCLPAVGQPDPFLNVWKLSPHMPSI